MHAIKKILASTLTVFCVAVSDIYLAEANKSEVTNNTIQQNYKSHLFSQNVYVKKSSIVQEKTTSPEKTPAVIENYSLDYYESDYQVNPDYSYTQIISSQATILTQLGIEYQQRASQDYYPDSQSLELLDAYVIKPNGEKIKVSNDNIFTRSSQESQNAPGFTNSMTISVVFPQLTVGSKTFVKWKLIQKKPSIVGFSRSDTPLFSEPTVKNVIRISLPLKQKLRWDKRGDYVVTDEVKGNRRIITATIKNQPGRQSENGMVDAIDVSPLFIFTNLDTWEELGKFYWQQSRDKIIVTPEIKALANKITGSKQGLEAARAIYNWTTQNTKYVAIYLNESAGYVPHSSTDILKNGFGDCKDHVVLMQALLKAKGIESNAVLIDWGNMYQKLLLPAPEQFNHAMIYLPAYDLFANPTNQYASFGELDTSLSEKFVVIASEKSRVAYTPKSSVGQNKYIMTSRIKITPDGTIEGEGEMNFAGSLNSAMRSSLIGDTSEKLAHQLLSETPEGGTGTLEKSDLQNLDLPVTIKSKWNSPFAVDIGKKIYFATPVGINVYNPQYLRGYITPGKRLYPIVVGMFDATWQYKIILPPGYKVSHLPENRQFSNSAGDFTSSYESGDGFILVNRNLNIKQNIFTASEYDSFKELIYKPINDVRSIMVLDKIN
jgi:Domain of Unknown Function with PDB structure (DUF3857)/Domain of Unknown Function with PDB structure (DUF3858)/Transglutaminase-like superfamily